MFIKKSFHQFQNLDKTWRAYFTFIGAVILIAFFFVFGAAMPYEPYTKYDFYVVPSIVCPGDPVNVRIDRKIEGRFYYSVDTIESTSIWLQDGEELPMNQNDDELIGQSYPLDPAPRGVVDSRLTRTAPLESGERYAGSVNVVRGKMFGIVPTSQTLGLRADDPLVIKEPFSPDCIPQQLEDGG